MSLENAREYHGYAKKQLDRAANDWWEPADPASCVTNVFYAYENLIVAVAEAHDIGWTKNHYKKAELAKELAEKKFISSDISAELLRLNDLRKDVSYGEPGEELENEDLEGLVTALERMVDEVDTVIADLEEESTDEE